MLFVLQAWLVLTVVCLVLLVLFLAFDEWQVRTRLREHGERRRLRLGRLITARRRRDRRSE